MRQLRSSDFRKKIDFSKNYLETLLAFYFSTGEERENISKERRDSLCFRFKRRRRKIYQIILPATPFLPPGLLASAPYFSLIRSILFCLGPRKPDSLSPPSPPSLSCPILLYTLRFVITPDIVKFYLDFIPWKKKEKWKVLFLFLFFFQSSWVIFVKKSITFRFVGILVSNFFIEIFEYVKFVIIVV